VRSRTGRFFVALVLVGTVAFASLMLTILLTLAVWPGEAKLTASIYCDDAHPDAFVVSDTQSYRPGETSTTFTLYCVGPNGEATNAGWMGPFMVLWAAHALVIVGLVILLVVVRRLRRRRRGPRKDRSPPLDESGFPVAPPPP
jgi:hypothetical protein